VWSTLDGQPEFQVGGRFFTSLLHEGYSRGACRGRALLLRRVGKGERGAIATDDRARSRERASTGSEQPLRAISLRFCRIVLLSPWCLYYPTPCRPRASPVATAAGPLLGLSWAPSGWKKGMVGSLPDQPQGPFTKVYAAIVRGNAPMAAPASTPFVADSSATDRAGRELTP
jgi:hypothetical protein